MTSWTAIVQGTTDEPLTIQRQQELGKAVRGPVLYDSADGRLSVTLAVEAPTLRQATEAALKSSREAIQGAEVKLTLTEVRVVTTEQLRRELEQPRGADLVGVVEAAQILGISRQRLDELVQTRNDFPPPIARLSTGKIFTRASIEAFNQRWERKPGRPKKTA